MYSQNQKGQSMQLISVNIGEARQTDNRTGTTGIYKFPTTDSVTINELGLQGDIVADKKHHGGVDQAVYVYGTMDYEWWSQELGKELEAGIFGENLTISDLESANLCIGDQLHIGDVTLQVTAPRIPCGTLANRMDDPQFVKKFAQSERYGAYCRVLQTGAVKTGDSVTFTEYDGERVSLTTIAGYYYSKAPTEADLRHALTLPIAIRFRDQCNQKLAKLTV